MKGLNDAPICYIEDNTEPRYLLSPPSGQDFSRRQYHPPGSTRFSARGNVPPAVGVGEYKLYHYREASREIKLRVCIIYYI